MEHHPCEACLACEIRANEVLPLFHALHLPHLLPPSHHDKHVKMVLVFYDWYSSHRDPNHPLQCIVTEGNRLLNCYLNYYECNCRTPYGNKQTKKNNYTQKIESKNWYIDFNWQIGSGDKERGWGAVLGEAWFIHELWILIIHYKCQVNNVLWSITFRKIVYLIDNIEATMVMVNHKNKNISRYRK